MYVPNYKITIIKRFVCVCGGGRGHGIHFKNPSFHSKLEGEGYIYAKLLERPYDLAAPLFLILHMNVRKAMCPVAKQNIISSSQ